MWKCILVAKELIKQGSRWQVGNGEKIRIWGENWLANPCYSKIQSPTTVLGNEAQVKELLMENGSKLNVNLLNCILQKEEVDFIQHIPISKNIGVDRLIWGVSRKTLSRLEAHIIQPFNSKKTTKGETSKGKEEDKLWVKS